MIDRFSACLDDVDNWLTASRLRPNASKTHVTWLGSSQQLQRLNIPHVDIQSTRVDVVDTARDLGVIIDSQLFSAQVAALSRSGYIQLWQLPPIIRSLTMEAAKTIARKHLFRVAWTIVIHYFWQSDTTEVFQLLVLKFGTVYHLRSGVQSWLLTVSNKYLRPILHWWWNLSA